jgi:hypothetical protein
MLQLRAGIAVVVAIAAASCGPGDSQFTTRVAPAFEPARHAVSVFGVYKDGQMSTDSWGGVAGAMSPVFGGNLCDAAYTDSFVASNPSLSSAIDDVVRADGFSDPLLTRIAPAAEGDLVLVLTMAGRLPVHPKTSLATEAAANGRPGSGRGTRGGGGRPSAARRRDDNVLDISAILFSVRERRSVGVVENQYSGASFDQAIAAFAERLAHTLPGARCATWNWAVALDPEGVRQTMSQE